ncbi:MAG: two component transcriptional regulator, LuxR family [Thermoleophilia bacterium]|nr:two component transcriptional regulator, LuxR family [Thermoleophilia bacterium]
MREQNPCRVVICDDAPEIRLILRTLLDVEPGFEFVGEAANGYEALEIVAQHNPDVLVLDLSMPVMDGFQALSALSKRAVPTRVVVYSAHDSDANRERIQQLGACAFVRKGGDPTEVISAVRMAAAG